ncbi:MAG: SGNH/GDSL hydrolase family protein [Phycisphaerae bacterium]
MLAMSPVGYLLDYVVIGLLYVSVVVNIWCFFRFVPRDRRPRLRLVLGNLLIFIGLLATAGMAGETYLRFVCVRTDGFGMSLPAYRWFLIHTRLNSHGCRNREWTRAAPVPTRRIAFVGDSFTYGWGIDDVEDRFTNLLQTRFRQRPGTQPVEVFNVAKPGWGTAQQRQPIEDIIDRYGVFEVVLCYVPNDIESVIPKSGAFDPTVPPDSWWVNPSGSCMIDFLYRRFLLPLSPTVHGYHDWLADAFSGGQPWQAHRHDLEAIIAACRRRGAKLRVVLFPFLRTAGDRFDQRAILAELARFLQSSGVEVLNLLPIFEGLDPRELTVNPSDSHPNERAHTLAADAIWKTFYQGERAGAAGD